MTRAPTRPASLLLISAGFIVWALAFTLLYGGLSVGCAFGWQSEMIGGNSLLRVVLLAIWGLHIVALIGLLIYCVRLPRSDETTPAFTRKAAIGTTVTALVATVWTGLPIPALSQCV
ncbi:hypothetical protein LPW26_08340 [Rhodopseudomonas sp. HC1]|uniref:hypothetical protein n=1 Tax=Rhodopseudomonas infernalis TaxID=2897386 RepID=UPI001EE80FCB|nr:hypothetical protein [Rhodopseudomonas infernalis]MCG6204641.1 hypothetical protein [Rhodopseudomonas infernalis]